jgi:uncharacterized protein
MLVYLRAARWRLGAGVLLAASLSALAMAQVDQTQRFFRIGTAASDGAYFSLGGIIANAISNPPGSRPCDRGGSCGVPGLIAVAQSTQGSVENLELIVKGELESGFCQADIAYAAFKGLGRFSKAPVTGLRTIASLYREAVHIVVRGDSGIVTVAELKGKRVAVGEEGSGTLSDAEAILNAYKLKRSDVQVQYLRPGQASDALRKGRIDAFFLVAGAPADTVAELAETIPIRLLPISAEAIERLHQTHPFLTRAVIPAGTYLNVAEAETAGVAVEWVVMAGLDDDLVYGITKALWEKSTRKLLEESGPAGRQIQLERAVEGLAIPLHPGAERYYREIGVIK